MPVEDILPGDDSENLTVFTLEAPFPLPIMTCQYWRY